MECLDPFFERVASSNPFTDNRINSPSAADVDVDKIHERPFARLAGLARETVEQRRGIGVVLWGEAGIGKSHLLSRLSRWAHQDLNASFVYLHNLQASPENLPRSLLKSVLSILTWGRAEQFATTLLFRLVNAFLREALQDDPDAEYTWPEAAAAYALLVDHLTEDDPSKAALVDRTVYDVLFRFYGSAYRARQGKDDESIAALAVRWLSGDFLDAVEAQQLGLPAGPGPDEPVALADNQQIKLVFIALTRMALSRRQPFLLCFDQVDNLDADQAAALGRFLEALIDSSPDLLVVLAGIQATLLRWRTDKVIQDSAWDRLAQFEIPLQRISVPEGTAIVAARLERFLKPFRESKAIRSRQQEDALFPLGQPWVDVFLKEKIEVRPRDVITWAREGWRREQETLQKVGGPAWLAGQVPVPHTVARARPATAEQIRDAMDRKIAEKLAEEKAERLGAPHTLPPDAVHLAGLVFTLFDQSLPANATYPLFDAEQCSRPRRGSRPAYDWLVRQHPSSEDPVVRTGLLFLTTRSGQSATAALRRLVRDPNPPERVIVVTDERTSLPLGAAGKKHYEELRRRGSPSFQHIELTFEQYAELDALQATVGLGRSGDLEIELPGGEIRPVSDKEVIESHQRQGRYLAAAVLHELLTSKDSVKRTVPAC
jgi:hypothetical protein